MPSILTHYGFNKELFDRKIDFLKNNEDIYLVGAQGPDPFFFRGLIPSFFNKNSKDIRKYGSRLHKMSPDQVFSFLFNYANQSEHRDTLFSYIYGAGMHYILDRKIHPYVYYKTGFSDNKKEKRRYFVSHTLFETNIDVLLMNGLFDKYKVKPQESIECDIFKINCVSEMYGSLAKDFMKEKCITNASFKEAYNDMKKIEKILYSKKGVKKKIVDILLKNTPINTMMHPRKVKDDNLIDYLNIKNNDWKDPCLEIIYNKSVHQLIDEAKEEVTIWKKIVIDAYNEIFNEEELKLFTKQMIYDGYNSKMKMKVFDYVFKRKENK